MLREGWWAAYCGGGAGLVLSGLPELQKKEHDPLRLQ